jgi:hypothetical protein
MAEYIPHGKKLILLHRLCRRAGAPHFESEREMFEWIRSHLEEMRLTSARVSRRFVSAVLDAKIGPLREVANNLQWQIVWNALREQAKRNCVFKALHTPLQLIPQSLHPNGSVA